MSDEHHELIAKTLRDLQGKLLFGGVFVSVTLFIFLYLFLTLGLTLGISLSDGALLFLGVAGLVCCFIFYLYTSIKNIFVIPIQNSLDKTSSEFVEQQLQFHSILNSIPEIIFYKDPDGKYMGANSAYEELVGRYGDDLVGLTDNDLFPTDVANKFRMKDMEVMCSCMLDVNEEVVMYPCGMTKDLEMIKVPYFDDQGGLIGLIGLGRDITDRKELEESLVAARNKAESATRARSEFLANMSHEIRTPMNGVVTMAELICDQQLTSKVKECAVTIRDSSKILLGVLNDILDFSKIDEGKLDVCSEPFSCKKMVTDMVALYMDRADAKGVDLIFDYADSIPLCARGDELRIRQVLANIISNAIKFCPQGQVSFVVAYVDRQWSFTVTDTGIGMTDEQLSRVFTEFEQANSSIGQRFGGTGLGLAISKKLTELMGGSLEVESVFGAGSTLTVKLPLEIAGDDEVGVDAITSTESVSLHAKILLAEDNKFNKAAFSMFFEDKLGCSVDWAENGEIAVQLARDNTYDVIFMDCHMPIMDGLEATRLIRKEDGRVPIVALTADVMPEVKQQCFAAGMNDFSVKPFDLNHLEQLAIKYSPNSMN